MSNLCIIPARGGSKRIPRKNIRDFFGKPIIAYSIEAALKSDLFDVVMVSTDDKEIAEIALQFGAEVPFLRSKENADDFATTDDVIREVLRNYSKHNQEFDFICCCYPASPLTSPTHLLDGLNTIKEKGASLVYPIVKFSYPIGRSLKKEADGRVKLNWAENGTERSQDLSEAFHDAGQWYWYNVSDFIHRYENLTTEAYGIELSNLEVQDIDNIDDWILAELKFQLRHNSPKNER